MNHLSKGHPYWHIRSIIEPLTEVIDYLHLSYYLYTPGSKNDVRKVSSIKAEEFCKESFIVKFIEECRPGIDVAIHSQVVKKDGSINHIPMIDFSTTDASKIYDLQNVIELPLNSFRWFSSGRSFHGYGSTLINPSQFIDFMGSLLIANAKGEPEVVDSRWVGHRLIGGYAALRWTRNSPHYIDLPHKISLK